MTDHDGTTRLWSDDELDEALRGLHSTPLDASEQRDPTIVLAIARAKVMAAANGDPGRGAVAAASTTSSHQPPAALTARARTRRRWIRVALAAGIAAVLVAIGLLVPSFITKQNKPVNSADAISALNAAAVAALGATDEPVAAGQFRYIETHSWNTVFSGYDIYQDENLSEVWVPAIPDYPRPGLDAGPAPDREPGVDRRQRGASPR